MALTWTEDYHDGFKLFDASPVSIEGGYASRTPERPHARRADRRYPGGNQTRHDQDSARSPEVRAGMGADQRFHAEVHAFKDMLTDTGFEYVRRIGRLGSYFQ
jgi:hypothetical protein